MATTISWDGLRGLAEFRAVKGCAVTLYVDLRPSVAANVGELRSRIHALLEESAKPGCTDGFGRERRESLRSDVERIRGFFDGEFDRDGAAGVAVFASNLDNVWQVLPLSLPIADAVRVGEEFYLAPLVPLVGRGDGALVALVGRELGRLFRLHAGRLEEIVDRSDEVPRRHDQGGWAQARLQRHVDKLANSHLRDVAGELEQRFRALGRPRIVIVCSEAARAELAGLLSPDVTAAVVAWAQAKARASVPEIESVVLPLLDAWRAEREAEAVTRWRDGVGRGGKAVAGWEPTLEAASDGRVELLLFEEGAGRSACRCPACGRVSVAGGACPLDGAALEQCDDGLDLAVRRTLAHGGTALAVRRGEFADGEGVGALLRF